MTCLLIIAHAPLASALKQAADHAFPEAASRIRTCDVAPDARPEVVESQARELLAQALAQAGCEEALILTDAFGATPANVAQRIADGERVRALAGVNVPMLWRALNYVQEPLDRLVVRALDGGAQGIMQMAPAEAPAQAKVEQGRHGDDAHQHQQ